MDRLLINQQLNVNDQLVAANGKSKVVMQGDGNLVVYRTDNGKPLWASNTWNTPVNRAVMQGDGNLVCYDKNGKAYWSTGTWGQPGAWAYMQDDGNFVLYGPNGGALWASNTVQNWDPMTVSTGDVHLDTGEWMNTMASVASTGLISGHTRTWCTILLRGFHGSALPLLLDGAGKAIWPSDPDNQKHQYGVDGVWIGTHDRTDYWANQVDPAVLAQAQSLAVVEYLDPKNQLLNDIGIIAKTLPDIIAIIKAIAGAVGSASSQPTPAAKTPAGVAG